jgi:tRNA (guanine-N7-)-methyltransferase
MGQKKLVRFAELETFKHVLQYPENMAGKWHEWFPHKGAVTLELACGKGEYAVGLGRMYPDKNFIGVDQKGNRLWVGAKQCIQENLSNVGFLRTQIDQIATYFDTDEVTEIWITFPDPQLRNSKHKKRLTHPKYLRLYHQFLKQGGKIHLKTDSPNLYRFTRKVIELYGLNLHESTEDLYAQNDIRQELKIKTHYEQLDIAGSNKIHYCCFSLSDTLMDTEKDQHLKNWVFEQEEMR